MVASGSVIGEGRGKGGLTLLVWVFTCACTGVTWPEDRVGDLIPTPGPGSTPADMVCGCDRDGDGFSMEEAPGCSPLPLQCPPPGDCDDQNPRTYPGARENTLATCVDGIDNNCNGTIDGTTETVTMKHFISMMAIVGTLSSMGASPELDSCGEPVTDLDGDGFTVEQGDCDDTNASIYPGAPDGVTADGVTSCDGIDNDCDGEVDEDCDPTGADRDNDGFPSDVDCNDADASVYPGAREVCDGIDNNCDGVADEGCDPAADSDGDGVPDGRDCAPRDPSIYPGAPESCDRIDNDCDGQVDEGCNPSTDADGDGYPAGEDCNDRDPNINPGMREVCDGIDNNCNGDVDEGCDGSVDSDGDGVSDDRDCAPRDATVYPGAVEICDRKDNDCDGVIDEGCVSSTDADGDGYPAGTDCNDQDASIYPGAREICDRKDNDCDGIADEGC